MAVVLLQESSDGARPVSRAQPLHSADQTQEYAAVADGRGTDHPPGHRILRAVVSVAQYAVTAAGCAAIVWVLWYFLFSGGAATAATVAEGVQEVRITVQGGYNPDTIVVQAGKPVRLQFYRAERADCSERLGCGRFTIEVRPPQLQRKPLKSPPGEAPSAGLNRRMTTPRRGPASPT